MSEDAREPVKLVSVGSEMTAAMIVARLKDDGIEAVSIGELTSGLRAEVPGGVDVLVHEADLERAQSILRDMPL